MRILVERFNTNKKATLSNIRVLNFKGDLLFKCAGLEDPIRESKIAGVTCIPQGTYKIKVRDFGGFHEKYFNKFNFHKGMLEIANVPNFSDILIHVGNFPEDTAGCLLIGERIVGEYNSIFNSKTTYSRFYQLVIDRALKNKLTISFINTDGIRHEV